MSPSQEEFSAFQLEIAPEGVLSFSYFIYAWQVVWILYAIHLLRAPQFAPLIPYSFFLPFIGSQICIIICPFVAALAENFLLPVYATMSWVANFSVIAAFVLLNASLRRQCPLLLKNGHCWDVSLIYGLVQNGVGLYTAWCSVAAAINSGISLYFFHGLERTAAGAVVLIIVAAEVSVFIAFDMLFLDRWTHCLITPYLTVIWVLSAILTVNKVTMKCNSVLTLALLCLVSAATLVKVTAMVWRHKRNSNQSLDAESNTITKDESFTAKTVIDEETV